MSAVLQESPVVIALYAAREAARAEFTQAFNVREGFEGDITEQKQRGSLGGWRLQGLPWIQD